MNELQKLLIDASDLDEQQRRLTSRFTRLLIENALYAEFVKENYPTTFAALGNYPRSTPVRNLEMMIREMDRKFSK